MPEGLILAITLVRVAVVLIAAQVPGHPSGASVCGPLPDLANIGENRIERAVRRIEKRLDDAGIGSTGSA